MDTCWVKQCIEPPFSDISRIDRDHLIAARDYFRNVVDRGLIGLNAVDWEDERAVCEKEVCIAGNGVVALFPPFAVRLIADTLRDQHRLGLHLRDLIRRACKELMHLQPAALRVGRPAQHLITFLIRLVVLVALVLGVAAHDLRRADESADIVNMSVCLALAQIYAALEPYHLFYAEIIMQRLSIPARSRWGCGWG